MTLGELLGLTDGEEPSVEAPDLEAVFGPSPTIIVVRPRRRTYLHPSEVGYDWVAGAEFVVSSCMTPSLRGQVISILERHNLKQMGYEAIRIVYNYQSEPMEVNL